MVKSMTGYGKAEANTETRMISVEIRSLNSKQADISVKMPSAYRQFEYEIRNRVAKAMQRGKIDVYISYEKKAEAASAGINRELFAAYYDLFTDLTGNMQGHNQAMDGFMLSSILRMPDVVAGAVSDVSDEEREALFGAVEEALRAIESFRTQEGDILMKDILGRVAEIRRLKEEVVPYEKRRVDTVRERIRESIAALELKVDENRLEQEIIFYVEKLDITEEKVRLDNHCKYFNEVAGSEEAPGRKLGFIAQEIGREINTLGSKANDSDIQKIVVQMKDELEKIKEQLLNLL